MQRPRHINVHLAHHLVTKCKLWHRCWSLREHCKHCDCNDRSNGYVNYYEGLEEQR